MSPHNKRVSPRERRVSPWCGCIAAGGNIVEYGKRLTERQDAEIAIYERTRADVDRARKAMSEEEFLSFWEKCNDQLRNLGIRLVPLE